MHDRLQSGVDALERVPVPVLWADVLARPAGPEAADPTPHGAGGPGGRFPPRLLLVAAAVLVVCMVGGALVVRSSDDTSKIDTVGSARDANAAQTSKDGKLFEAATLTAEAAHEMQVETELAVLLTASNYDPAARLEWEAQAPSSDKAMESMREQLDKIDVEKLDGITRSALSLVTRTADSPRTARSIVGGGVTDWPAALEVYGNIWRAFVEASSRLANSVSSPELNDAAQSWGIAVQIEADVAAEQVMLTGVLTVGSFSGPDENVPEFFYESFVETVNAEVNHTRMLEDLGEPDVLSQMRFALSGDEVSLADDLRERAIDGKDSPSLEMDVTVWRDASGKKLDRVRDAEMKVADSILTEASQLASRADEDRDDRPADTDTLFIAGALLVALAAVVLAFLLGRRTTRPRST